MIYSIRHLTRFRYEEPVSESLMETRMHPRTEGVQRCLSFQLALDPRTRVHSYRDYLGNTVDHFDVPGHHKELRILATSLVELQPPPEVPEHLGWGGWNQDAWNELDAMVAAGDYWEMLMPSHFVEPSEGLLSLVEPLGATRREDPIAFLRQLNAAVFSWFDYVPKSTQVDSPIQHAIETRKGVCQDFAHIMIALVRYVKIPCRYVSGYMYHGEDRSDRSVDGATHAWLEALVPGFGWVGFDPTNNLVAGERHVRTAIGRDYADVPPTKGIFKGDAASELTVTVRVSPSGAPPPPEMELIAAPEWQTPNATLQEDQIRQEQQQQQQ